MKEAALKICFGAAMAFAVFWGARLGTLRAGNMPLSGTANIEDALSASSTVVLPQAAAPQPFVRVQSEPAPSIGAREAIVADLETGKPYFALHAADRWPMASVTKLMTGAYALDHMDASSSVTLAAPDFENSGDVSSHLVKAGERYSRDGLLSMMFAFSSNEAADALANAKGRLSFVAGLNGQAGAWGLSNTYFEDPTGISAANQSTPEDLVVLGRHIYHDYSQLLSITRTPRVTVRELSRGGVKSFTNINQFAGHPDFIGGKTGYTGEAQENLLSIFSYGNRPVIIVVLGTGDRFGDTSTLLSWFKRNFNPAT